MAITIIRGPSSETLHYILVFPFVYFIPLSSIVLTLLHYPSLYCLVYIFVAGLYLAVLHGTNQLSSRILTILKSTCGFLLTGLLLFCFSLLVVPPVIYNTAQKIIVGDHTYHRIAIRFSVHCCNMVLLSSASWCHCLMGELGGAWVITVSHLIVIAWEYYTVTTGESLRDVLSPKMKTLLFYSFCFVLVSWYLPGELSFWIVIQIPTGVVLIFMVEDQWFLQHADVWLCSVTKDQLQSGGLTSSEAPTNAFLPFAPPGTPLNLITASNMAGFESEVVSLFKFAVLIISSLSLILLNCVYSFVGYPSLFDCQGVSCWVRFCMILFFSVACQTYRYLKTVQTVMAGIKLVQPFQRATYDQIVDSSDPCAICLAPLHEGRLTPCGHIFHSKCLATHLHFKTTCPMCNTPVIHITRVGPNRLVIHHHQRHAHANVPQDQGPNFPIPNQEGPNVPEQMPQGPNVPEQMPQGPNVPEQMPQGPNVPEQIPQGPNLPEANP